MTPGPTPPPAPGRKAAALTAWRIVLIYAIFACLWILFSDRTVALLFHDPATITMVSLLKGWLFVGVTSFLLFGLIKHLVDDLETATEATKSSESALLEAQHIAGIGSFVLDFTRGQWAGSQVCHNVFGVDAQHDHSLDGWLGLIHPDDRAAMSDDMHGDVVGQQRAFNRQFRILRASDGAERWVHGLGRLTVDAQGQAVDLRGTVQDISEKKRAEAEIESTQSTLRATLDALPDLLFEVDRLGLIHSYHSHRSDLLAAAPEVFLGKSFADVLPADVTQVCFQAIEEAAQLGYSAGKTYALDLPQGRRWFELSVAPMADVNHAVPHFIFISRDVTERHSAEEKLQLASRVFSHAREGIVIMDATGTILDVNDSFTRITGYLPKEAIGHKPHILRSGQQGPEFYAELWRKLTTQGHWSGELWNRHKNGTQYALSTTISSVRDQGGQVLQYVGLFFDITSHKTHQHQLEHFAHFDALTDLPNRVLLADRLRQAMVHAQRRGQALAVAYLDLDGFKTVNDRHGHDIGDQLLIALSNTMKEALREGDTLARMGGDEFVAVLIDQTNEASCVPMLHRLLSAAAAPVQLGDLTLQVSASLGVTFYPQAKSIDADQLLRQADQALYQAKVAGKNRYQVFDAQHDKTVRDHHESVERIRLALERGEFVLHYQPKVNMRSGSVTGAEALIRWQHPDKGLLAPALFLPAIETHPLAVALGEWVIDMALTQMERWSAVGLALPVSVNVGALQLQNGNFVERLTAILDKHPSVNPSQLQIEVLETSALADMTKAARVIEDCARIGVMFALDDFGTGYSSLTYLKSLRVHMLKIDQSFVRDMLEDPDDLAILEGVIGLAAAFKREVIAEGVETAAHGAALMRLGCDLAQGYGIARPMPGEDMPAWAAAWQPAPVWAQPT